jgi:hypothetical protein
MTAFFKMDVDRFNEVFDAYSTTQGYLTELKDKDPVTKILTRYAALSVAFAENEDGEGKSNLSDIEWAFIKKIDVSIKLTKEVLDDVKADAFKLIKDISCDVLLELNNKRKEEGRIYKRLI